MAKCNETPICVINYKAEVLAYYGSIKECIQVNGFPASSVYKAVYMKRIYRCMRFIHETEYRKHWENGTLDQICFKKKKERNKDAILPMLEARKSKEVEERRRKRISESVKRKKALGVPMHWEKAQQFIRKPVICIDTGFAYQSVAEAARQIGVTATVISRAIKRNWKVKGMKFSYEEMSL